MKNWEKQINNGMNKRPARLAIPVFEHMLNVQINPEQVHLCNVGDGVIRLMDRYKKGLPRILYSLQFLNDDFGNKILLAEKFKIKYDSSRQIADIDILASAGRVVELKCGTVLKQVNMHVHLPDRKTIDYSLCVEKDKLSLEEMISKNLWILIPYKFQKILRDMNEGRILSMVEFGECFDEFFF